MIFLIDIESDIAEESVLVLGIRHRIQNTVRVIVIVLADKHVGIARESLFVPTSLEIFILVVLHRDVCRVPNKLVDYRVVRITGRRHIVGVSHEVVHIGSELDILVDLALDSE